MPAREVAKKGGTKGGTLVPQGHGGALLPGGQRGQTPGPGRPPSALREHCRGAFANRIKVLKQIADGKPFPQKVHVGDGMTMTLEVSAAVRERIRAIDLLGKYGGVDKLALTVEEQPEQVLTPERAAMAYAALEMVRSVRGIERLLTGASDDPAE